MDRSDYAQLQSRYPFEIRIVDEVESTNSAARELAERGCEHGTTVLAERQTQGRGRLGRRWLSPTGANLMCSTVLRPELLPSRAALVCLGAAVAVCRASPVPLHVKWPNDILDSGGAKLGGILAEAEFLGGEVEYLVLGIGLNVEAPPSSVPNTTCLGALGFDPSQTLALGFRVVEELLSVTALLEREPSDVLGMWRQYSATLGAQVQVGELSGTAVDIGDDGALIVRGADDQIHRVLAGDVQLLRTMTGRS